MANNDDGAQSIILFYKYHPLSSEESVTEVYRHALESLCQSLKLTGRILVGCSKTEGINGTLAGAYENVKVFTQAMLRTDDKQDGESVVPAVQLFYKRSTAFFASIGAVNELIFGSEDDFKWSSSTSAECVFPDLNVKLVGELIGTGGAMASIPLTETSVGYLTPKEWHDTLKQKDDNTIVVDCRNTKEYEIGHFVGATDPKTTAFSQFPKWVQDHKLQLENKKILMYCTGGIRCEKASAYIRREVPSVQAVRHLKGGIHKYLDEFGDSDAVFQGKNYVFDSRGDSNPQAGSKTGNQGTVVGRCVYCVTPFDSFDPRCVCTVCREPALVCRECQDQIPEYHCRTHLHLRMCYFSDLTRYTEKQLTKQLNILESFLAEIAVGRRFRQKRKTLQKQISRVTARIHEVQENPMLVIESVNGDDNNNRSCRNCGDSDCNGRCWGFYGLKRKKLLEHKDKSTSSCSQLSTTVCVRAPQRQQNSKKVRREAILNELIQLQIVQPPSLYRDQATGIRVPPSFTRLVQCGTKAKWCGESVVKMLQHEFEELSKIDVLNAVLCNGLLRLNDKILSPTDASELQLKSSDTISRVLHWHEAPVFVPERIGISKYTIPSMVLHEYESDDLNDSVIFVCNKPSSVPVHPAGPYLANSLTMMVEGQLQLQPQSLRPLHRTDRVTSGLTLCCTNPAISRAFQKSLAEGAVDKLYLTRVSGKFPISLDEFNTIHPNKSTSIGTASWIQNEISIFVDAPVQTIDPAAGLRTVHSSGKSSQSKFRSIHFDEDTNTSLLSCFPITGRNHQLRVHLQWLGFPIINDIQYSGQAEESRETSPSVRIMLESQRMQRTERRLESLSDNDVAAARRVCRCCETGTEDAILRSFTPAQLLIRGHAICLHALRYRVRILPRKSKKTEKDLIPIAELEFGVDAPDWVDSKLLEKLVW